MKQIAAGRRLERRKQEAVSAVLDGMTYREAARRFRVAKSTIVDAITRKRLCSVPRSGRPPVFSDDEESSVVDLLCHFANHGVPLTRVHATDAFAALIKRLPQERRERMPFKAGRPGRKFLKGFETRHKASLSFSRPTRQEAKRFGAVNAETLTTHFAVLEKLVQDYNIDAQRVWNLDETGGTPGRDVAGNSARRRYLHRGGTRDFQLAKFVRASRVTVMPVVSAAGDTRPPLFVFKGNRFCYRQVMENGVVVEQTYASMLPRGAVVAAREDVGGVDSANFYLWAKVFVQSVRDLTTNGRKVLLTYDAYRAHMTFQVLELFKENNIIVYALPAQTSGKTQPCDVVLFGAFKSALNETMTKLVEKAPTRELDMFDYCRILRQAYHDTFTRENIVSSFRRSGLWPVDSTRLLSVPRPRDENNLAAILPVEALENLLDQKRDAVHRGVLGSEVHVLAFGFLDTKRRAVLTSNAALAAARENAMRIRQKKDAERLASARKELAAARRAEKEKKDLLRHENAKWRARAIMNNMTVPAYKAFARSIEQKRAVARLRTQLWRQRSCPTQ